MLDINIDDWPGKLAGAAGALISMRFLEGPPLARLSMAISGAVLAFYMGPWLSERISVPLQLSGFLLGMFGMAIVSRAWEFVRATPVSALWDAVIDRIRGRKGV